MLGVLATVVWLAGPASAQPSPFPSAPVPVTAGTDSPDDRVKLARGRPAGPSGGGARPSKGGGTAVRPRGKPPGPLPGEPQHRRPPDGHRDGGRHDRHGGRAIVGVWPSLWWDPWWEPYWYHAPPPVIIQEPPPVYVQQPLYWYYCQSAQAYHPSVASCPEPWIPVPATP